MNNKVKVGISGLGRSGWRNHAGTLAQLPSMYDVAAVFDPIEERRREAAEKFGCKTHADFDSLIGNDEVELLVIATPSHLHAPQAFKALKAGKQVVCEKPMATSLAEADAMIEAAKDTGNLLTIFQNRRYGPDFLKIEEVIKSGKLGRIVLIKMSSHSFKRRWDWQTLRRFGGGELRNYGPHIIDQALQLFGPNEPEIFCDVQRAVTLGDAEDHVKIILKAPESPLIDIEVSRACAYPQDRWVIMGTQGGLTGSSSSLRWKYFDPKDLPPRQVDERPTPDRSYNIEEIPWKEEIWDMDRTPRSDVLAFYTELYETLRHGAPLKITPESVRRVMWVIQECLKQSE
ncbi:MAG: Gfo/Idh/MocA family oxidoreductase [Candidatus Bathyarchaeota archaeon]|nr:Gfo/Idh/MocA family oxidoreductase [Candidatus Bathyarchaeota archaeon]